MKFSFKFNTSILDTLTSLSIWHPSLPNLQYPRFNDTKLTKNLELTKSLHETGKAITLYVIQVRFGRCSGCPPLLEKEVRPL